MDPDDEVSQQRNLGSIQYGIYCMIYNCTSIVQLNAMDPDDEVSEQRIGLVVHLKALVSMVK